MHRGDEYPFWALIEVFPQHRRQRIFDAADQQVSDFGAQLEFRFDDFQRFQKKWALYNHPAATSHDRQRLVDEFFSFNDCCRVSVFGQVIHQYFGGDKQALLSSQHFTDLVRLYASAFKHTDMVMERLLALIRHMCPSHAPAAERVVADGFLGQVLKEHFFLGGKDPRGMDRQQVLEHGVALRCAKSAGSSKKSQASGAFVEWMKGQHLTRPSGRMDINSYAAWQASKILEWKHVDPAVGIVRRSLLCKSVQEAFCRRGPHDRTSLLIVQAYIKLRPHVC